jgi:hypothetical protein
VNRGARISTATIGVVFGFLLTATGGLGGLLVLAGLIAGLRLRGLTERAPRSRHPQAIPEQRQRLHPPLDTTEEPRRAKGTEAAMHSQPHDAGVT